MLQGIGAVALLSFKRIGIHSQKFKKILISKVKRGFRMVEFHCQTPQIPQRAKVHSC